MLEFIFFGGLGALFGLIALFLLLPSMGIRRLSPRDWIQVPRHFFATIFFILAFIFLLAGVAPLLSY